MSVIVSLGRSENRQLLRSALSGILLAAAAAVVIGVLLATGLGLSNVYLGKALLLFGAGAALLLVGLSQHHHPFQTIGPANLTTVARGTLIALLGGLVGEHSPRSVPAVATAVAIAATILDAVDGQIARRTKMTSVFGARFDMETDAVLILVLSILAWQFGKAGVWVLASGLLRYLYVAAGLLVPALRRSLPQSFRRKTIAVVQMIVLLAAIAPFIPRAISEPLAAAALLALLASFTLDVVWLARHPAQYAVASIGT